jgi:hypothetical protein
MKRPLSFEQAKAQYIQRYTLEHVPTWAGRTPADSGGTETRFYAPQFRTDREWYENTLFPGEGHVGKHERQCYTTNQSWPLGKWLDRPFH